MLYYRSGSISSICEFPQYTSGTCFLFHGISHLGVVVVSFCCYDKYADKKQLRNEGIYLCYNSKLQLIVVGKARHEFKV